MTIYNIVSILIGYILIAAFIFCVLQARESVIVHKDSDEYDGKLSLNRKILISINWLIIALVYVILFLIIISSVAIGCVVYPIYLFITHIRTGREVKNREKLI